MYEQFAERLKAKDLSKLGNFKKIPEMLIFDDEYPADHPKAIFHTCAKKLRKVS